MHFEENEITLSRRASSPDADLLSQHSSSSPKPQSPPSPLNSPRSRHWLVAAAVSNALRKMIPSQVADAANTFLTRTSAVAASTPAENTVRGVLYAVGVVFVVINLYVLLNRNYTIHYLRLYHLAVGAVMVLCGVVMLIFMWRARSSTTMIKLKRPHSIPRPTLISAFLLTAGVALGYAYLFVFNLAFSNCDKLIDATSADEQWQESVYSLLMIGFCLLSLVYILQRSYYGAIERSWLDVMTRQWVNTVLTIVWIKIVIFKGYLSYQELCQRKEISGYWCPIVFKRPYQCDPEFDLKGTQKIWYYLHKGLLNSAIISCASEFFPVMLVGHWLACGRAEERADELIRRREEKKSVRRMLHGIMGNVQQACGVVDRAAGTSPTAPVTASASGEMTLLRLAASWPPALTAVAWLAGMVSLLRWAVGFYFAINFDRMHRSGSMVDDNVELAASAMQLCLFAMAYKWSLSVEEKRFDAHHKAESRGDLILIFGSAAFMTLKLMLQILELNFQRADGFLRQEECIIRVVSLTLIHASEWCQFLCLRRIMALHIEDVHATRRFLPSVALCALAINWVGFGMTFFETNIIKYQLGKPDFHFSQPTLISMIFTQTIYPADYLFMFTAAGCWTDVLLRYLEIGFFQLGKPVIDDVDPPECNSHCGGGAGHHHHAHRNQAYHSQHLSASYGNVSTLPPKRGFHRSVSPLSLKPYKNDESATSISGRRRWRICNADDTAESENGRCCASSSQDISNTDDGSDSNGTEKEDRSVVCGGHYRSASAAMGGGDCETTIPDRPMLVVEERCVERCPAGDLVADGREAVVPLNGTLRRNGLKNGKRPAAEDVQPTIRGFLPVLSV